MLTNISLYFIYQSEKNINSSESEIEDLKMTLPDVVKEEKLHNDPLRPFLKRAVCRMALTAGFEHSDNDAIETVVELYCSLLSSIAECSKRYAELGSRTVPLVQDVVSATTELGIDLDDAVQNLIVRATYL